MSGIAREIDWRIFAVGLIVVALLFLALGYLFKLEPIWMAVLATIGIAGFVSIYVFGVTRSILNPQDALPATITTGAGVFVEIIGATLLRMYQSAISQAMRYTSTLERINAVGMAMQILDTMPDEASEERLKDKTKARLIQSLMAQHSSEERIDEINTYRYDD